MDGSEQHDLLRRVQLLQLAHRDVYPSAHRGVVECRRAVRALLAVRLFVARVGHLTLVGVIPFAERNGVVIVVRAHEDDDGIDILPMLVEQGLRLARYVVPLPSAYCIAIACGVEPFAQQRPPLLCPGLHARVGDGISEIRYLLPLPGMGECLLAAGGCSEHREQKRHEHQLSFHSRLWSVGWYCFQGVSVCR